MPDSIEHVVADPDAGCFHPITVLQHFNDDLPYPWELVYVMVTIYMGWWEANLLLKGIQLTKKLGADFVLRQTSG
jgi:hypothetical protein